MTSIETNLIENEQVNDSQIQSCVTRMKQKISNIFPPYLVIVGTVEEAKKLKQE